MPVPTRRTQEDEILSLISGYFSKAYFAGTGDIHGAVRYASEIERQLRQMPKASRDAVIKSILSKEGMQLRIDPNEYASYTASGPEHEVVLVPYQLGTDRSDVTLHELGHDTDNKINKTHALKGGGIPASIENDIGKALHDDIASGGGIPKGRDSDPFAVLRDEVPDDYMTVFGMHNDQRALDPDDHSLGAMGLMLSGLGGHDVLYSRGMRQAADEYDPENKYTTPDSRRRSAQSLEGFAELTALQADPNLKSRFGTTAEELYPRAMKRYGEIVGSDPRIPYRDYTPAEHILERRRNANFIPTRR